MMEANKRGFKGVWLCAAIYESSELSAVEKLLLAEIDALTTDTDACYATNAHFSERLGVTVTRVDHLLGQLTRLQDLLFHNGKRLHHLLLVNGLHLRSIYSRFSSNRLPYR